MRIYSQVIILEFFFSMKYISRLMYARHTTWKDCGIMHLNTVSNIICHCQNLNNAKSCRNCRRRQTWSNYKDWKDNTNLELKIPSIDQYNKCWNSSGLLNKMNSDGSIYKINLFMYKNSAFISLYQQSEHKCWCYYAEK